MNPIYLILVPVAVAGAWYGYQWLTRKQAYSRKLKYYRRLYEPIVEMSRGPFDTKVEERVQEHLMLLEESGNPNDIPVMEFPFLDIQEDGKLYQGGYSETYFQYQIRAAKWIIQKSDDWQVNLKEASPSHHSAFALHQENEKLRRELAAMHEGSAQN